MVDPGEASRPRGGPADLVRQWLGALARLLLFGVLFVALVEIVGLLTFTIDARGGWAVAKGGLIWLVSALVASIIVMHTLDGRSWRALGVAPTADAMRQTGIGLAFGVAMIVAAVALMLLSGDLRWTSDDGTAIDAVATMGASLAMLAPAAAAEEALFRGYPIQVLARAGGIPLAVLTTSAAFAAVHGQNPAVGSLALVNIFIAGVLLAVVYMRTNSLWAATAVHLGWNWGMGGLFDLPVSGLAWIDVPAFEPWVTGPAWWNGGAFGPEGGLIGTLVFGAAVIYALRTPLLRPDPDAEPMLCAAAEGEGRLDTSDPKTSRSETRA
ncbi:MAG TPA: type II CAAX endopeptidase family protein [Longimicrobiales bacterium]|nr:type II CAAX endopeptidase family protein [Longimicrobiales bacterium]